METDIPVNKRNGFTLVEAIVVGVIFAVLAITAVMMYQGFITETRQQTVENLAEAGAAAANAYVRKTGVNLGAGDVDKLHLYYDAEKYTVTIDAGNRLIQVTDINHPTITGEAGY